MTSMDYCVICAQEMDADTPSDLNPRLRLECGHIYHGKCIIKWFRNLQTGCPLCRDNGSETIRPNDIRSRASMLSIEARKKDAPKCLVKMVNKLKKSEKKWTSAKKERLAYMRTNRDVFKEGDRIKAKEDKLRSAWIEQRRRVGLYNSPQIPLPLILPH